MMGAAADCPHARPPHARMSGICPSIHVFMEGRGEVNMYGVFGAYTRWAVVFLIIFVMFFLLSPGYGAAAPAGGSALMATYGYADSTMLGGYGSPSSS